MSKQDFHFKVLSKIQELNAKNIPAWYGKLKQELPDVTPENIMHALSCLSDWSLIHGEYGSIGNNRAGRLYFIDELPIEFQPSSFANEKSSELGENRK